MRTRKVKYKHLFRRQNRPRQMIWWDWDQSRESHDDVNVWQTVDFNNGQKGASW